MATFNVTVKNISADVTGAKIAVGEEKVYKGITADVAGEARSIAIKSTFGRNAGYTSPEFTSDGTMYANLIFPGSQGGTSNIYGKFWAYAEAA